MPKEHYPGRDRLIQKLSGYYANHHPLIFLLLTRSY